MKGRVYQRSGIWWATWFEKVKVPTVKSAAKKRWESSHSERKSDAITLLNTRVYESRQRGARPIGQEAERLTYENIRDRWLKHRATKGKPQILKSGDTYFAGRKHLDAYFGGWRAVNIEAEDIQKFQQMLRAKGLGNGINRAVSCLRALLNFLAKSKKKGLRLDQLPDEFPMLHLERSGAPFCRDLRVSILGVRSP
jgi:hypothetical protein